MNGFDRGKENQSFKLQKCWTFRIFIIYYVFIYTYFSRTYNFILVTIKKKNSH